MADHIAAEITLANVVSALEQIEPGDVYAIVNGRLCRLRGARIEEGVTPMPGLDYLSAEDLAAWEAMVATSTPGTRAAAGDFVPMVNRIIGTKMGGDEQDLSSGRRLRVFAIMVGWGSNSGVHMFRPNENKSYPLYTEAITYGAAMADCEPKEAYNELFRSLALRVGTPGHLRYSIDPNYVERNQRDPELPIALHDLAWEILEDIREACFALDDPDLYYPGVDEGIEPVPDDHVELVVWALQRELNRELRTAVGDNAFYGSGTVLPAPPLRELPWRIQRALVERRRLRYKQYGIGHDQWEAGTWSLWDVDLDPEFVPRRLLRKAGLL